MLRRKYKRSRASENRLVCKRIPRDKFKSSPRVGDNIRQDVEKSDSEIVVGTGRDDGECVEKGESDAKVSVSEVLRGVWSNMVSTMKAAVDSVLFGGEDESGDKVSGVLSPPKKRRSSLSGLRALRQSRRNKVKGSPLIVQTASTVTPACHLSDITPLMNNISTATMGYTKSSVSGSTRLPPFSSSNMSPSLTSMSLSTPLDELKNEKLVSSKGWRIRNDALRKYYQVSPEADNRQSGLGVFDNFSPILDWDMDLEVKEQDSDAHIVSNAVDKSRDQTLNKSIEISIPIAPPPPPPPLLPVSHIPLPPPLPLLSAVEATRGEKVDASAIPRTVTSSAMLAGMQSRLRSRMRKKDGKIDKARTSDGGLDVKLKQWAEIQARSRKITVNAFLVLADEKRLEVAKLVQSLANSIPTSITDIKMVCESLSVASEWFSGGNKEMKSSIALWPQVERKIELLTEFVQVTEAMSSLSAGCIYHDVMKQLKWLREEFEHKHNTWGQVLQSDARSWRSLDLPVNDQLLNAASQYIVNTAIQHALLICSQAKRIANLQTSLSNQLAEILKVKRHLQTSINLLSNGTTYMRLESVVDQRVPLVGCVADCAMNFMHLASLQYSAFVSTKNRQTVVEHFEETLKMLRSLKEVSSRIQSVQSMNSQRCCGYIEMFPSSDELSTALYNSCVTLMEHIASAAQPIISNEGGLTPSSSREVILWMMFGCKYVNRVLEMLGTERAEENGFSSLLRSLQQLETALPAL